MATTDLLTVRDLRGLVPRLHRADGFSGVVDSLKQGESAAVDGAWGSSCALSAAAIAEECTQTLLVILPRLNDVDEFAGDLAGFLGEIPTIFPAWETLPQEHDVADAVFGGRLRVLNEISGAATGLEEGRGDTETRRRGEDDDSKLSPHPRVARSPRPRVIVTSLPALLQPVPSQVERQRGTRRLQVGEEVDPDDLLRWLVERGFERVTGIERAGEFCMHGGILDIFPPDAADPLRFEFFGDEIESIRRFDVETQRKVADLADVELTIVAPVESGAALLASKQCRTGESFLESLPAGSWVVLAELQELVDEGRQYLARMENPRGLFSVSATLARCTEFPSITLAAIAADSMETSCHLQIISIERFTGPKSEGILELASVVDRDERILIACHNEGERQRLQELIAETELPSIDVPLAERVELCIGNLARGFRMVAEKLVVLSDHELFGRTDLRRGPARRKKLESRAIDSFLELNEGDLVVHLTNGIGRYRGMKLLEKDEQSEEHLIIEFRDGVLVYVPVSLIHLVQKYVGSAKSVPQLSKLGTTSWSKKKQRVAEAVSDMASDMLRLQADRESKPGIACPEDSHLQREFDAAFPFTETDDQVTAIADCKEDLQLPRPMDRLICGDVGYGKTEVAMRAAFKSIDAGRQVAVLVPTTVLAEQHFRTFSERMAEYPINVEVLSRFRTKSEQRKILERMERGAVDLVIGTHRLVQKDVRFKDLGLLIIDEEQRFGVAAKEMLKLMRLEVDVLTLSATPIPRTLHMSLLGIRDISNLQTPPHDRLAIETRICRFDAELIRNAIVREMNRGGQVFFVHNRVYNIQSIADRVQSIVPEATVAIVHGQMRGDDLEDAMFQFISRRVDVLVATTIIESGLDIPNANTIFIHQADKYGLADLHQLRGRVGRFRHRAYCYLLLEEGRTLTSQGAKRLKAIEEFSELGAGFKIAMRDLEIRGAGNILGTEQSGHIASVGYELYCQLLENAVRKAKNEPIREQRHVAIDLPVSAYIPVSYVPPGRPKIEVYRKLSSVGSIDELEELRNELRDRFGPLPVPTERLLEVKRLQLFARARQIDEIRLEDRFAVFGYRHAGHIRHLEKECGNRLRIVDFSNAYLLLGNPQATNDELLDELKSVLQPK